MIQIQERDREILETSYEQHFVRMDQVHRYIFSGLTERRVRQRISDLEQAGLIRREEHFLLRGRSLIRLTKNGVALAEERRVVTIPQHKHLDIRTLIHDGAVTSVRLRLKELWDGTWVPESMMKSENFPQIPDGMIVFDNGRQAAIEVENTPKGPIRFHQIQERWRGVEVRLVLYVATSVSMYRAVQRYLKSGPQDLPFGLVLWDDLDRGTPQVWTVMGGLDVFTRRSL